MAHVFVARKLPGPALDRLIASHEVDLWTETLPPDADELASRAEPAEGILTLLSDRVGQGLIDHCKRLRAISNYAVGLDNIDLAAATAARIPVGHTPDVLTDATADLTFALLLAVARKLPEALAAVHEGGWQTWGPAQFLGHEVHGATLGIIGMGRIGRAVGKRAEGFEMSVIHTGPDGGQPIPVILEQSDFVTLHCPLTPETRHLIDRDALASMRSHAILINTARGPIVDQEALREALVNGVIAGAALDVTDPEPLAVDDPLLSAPNLIVAPHIGSATRVAREKMTDLAVENLLAGLDGRRMPHQANEIT